MGVAWAASVAESAVTPRLRAGEQYPRTAAEFNAWFADEGACYAYLERLRWPNGIACPGCGEAGKVWHISRRALRCRACRHETSVTAGTILEDTQLPLTVWFHADAERIRRGDRRSGLADPHRRLGRLQPA